MNSFICKQNSEQSEQKQYELILVISGWKWVLAGGEEKGNLIENFSNSWGKGLEGV